MCLLPVCCALCGGTLREKTLHSYRVHGPGVVLLLLLLLLLLLAYSNFILQKLSQQSEFIT
jgi:hypothetical protein